MELIYYHSYPGKNDWCLKNDCSIGHLHMSHSKNKKYLFSEKMRTVRSPFTDKSLLCCIFEISIAFLALCTWLYFFRVETI